MLCVISIMGVNGKHDIQTNSGWTENPYSDYVVVPADMVQDIIKTKGYCEFEVKDEEIIGYEWVVNDETGKSEKVEKVIGTRKVVSKWTAGTIPEAEEPEQPVSAEEQLRADIDYIAIMTGVEL